MLIGSDQRQRRGKRHLEARLHHRFRRQQKDTKRCDRNRPERQCRPIHEDAEEDDRDHDE
jgi:hypothetical protein